MENSLLIPFGCFLIVISLFLFSLGIYEAIYVDKYDDSVIRDGCGGVWYGCAIMCVINFGCSFLLVPSIIEIVYQRTLDSIHINRIIEMMLVSRIWPFVSYFAISDSCRSFYRNDYPELLTIVEIETFVFLSLCLALISYCVYLCLRVNKSEISPKQKEEVKEEQKEIDSVV